MSKMKREPEPTPPAGGFRACQVCGAIGDLAKCSECGWEICETCLVDGSLCWGCNEARIADGK